MNFRNTVSTQPSVTEKTQELLQTLNSVENSYDQSSPSYRFTRVFYNIVDTPVVRPMNFPEALWDKYFIPNSPLMPVILNKQQIEERKKIQEELANKLFESKGSLEKRLESLRFKREMVRNKLENTVEKFRNKTRKYLSCDENVDIYKQQNEVIDREKFIIQGPKDELLKYLGKMRTRLETLQKSVKEAVHSSEKQMALSRQLDREY